MLPKESSRGESLPHPRVERPCSHVGGRHPTSPISGACWAAVSPCHHATTLGLYCCCCITKAHDSTVMLYLHSTLCAHLFIAACCQVLLASSPSEPWLMENRFPSCHLQAFLSPLLPELLQEKFNKEVCCCWKGCHFQSCNLPTPPVPSSQCHRHSLACRALPTPGHTQQKYCTA